MKIKSVLEGLVLSAPLVFGSIDIPNSNAYENNNPSAGSVCFVRGNHGRKLNEEDQAFEHKVWSIYGCVAYGAVCLYLLPKLYKFIKKNDKHIQKLMEL